MYTGAKQTLEEIDKERFAYIKETGRYISYGKYVAFLSNGTLNMTRKKTLDEEVSELREFNDTMGVELNLYEYEEVKSGRADIKDFKKDNKALKRKQNIVIHTSRIVKVSVFD